MNATGETGFEAGFYYGIYCQSAAVNYNWYVASAPSWLTNISPTSGYDNGGDMIYVTFDVEPNTGTTDRDDYIVFEETSPSALSFTMRIVQEPIM